MNSSVLSHSVAKVAELLRNKSLTATDLYELSLKRILRTKDLNAFISITEGLAQQQAIIADKRVQEGNALGILDGIPIAIKDNWSTQNIRTTCASKMLGNYIPPYNATVVQRLLNNGTIIVGKTNLDEFAMGSATVDSYFGPSKNPWRSGLKYKLKRLKTNTYPVGTESDTSCINVVDDQLPNNDFFVCGGSSGGAAVAVASGACFAAIASDTGGSTRNPAAFCGIVGLKPTYGLVSRHGLIPLCNSLDVPGILTRSVDDAVSVLNCISGYDPSDSTTVKKSFSPFTLPENICIKNLHFGIPKEYECEGMSQEIIETWKNMADVLANSGAKVTEVSLPHTKYSIMCYSVLCCCDVASNFARYDGIRYGHRAKEETGSTEHHYAVTRREGFGDVVRERILAGNYFLLKNNYTKYFLQAAKVRRLICDDFRSVFDSGVDLLLTPVTLTEPVPYSKWILVDNREHNAVDDFCTQSVNMAGLPAVSVPCKLSQNGLPLSLQLIGQSFQEKKMLAAAKWIEHHVQFPVLDIIDDVETL